MGGSGGPVGGSARCKNGVYVQLEGNADVRRANHEGPILQWPNGS